MIERGLQSLNELDALEAKEAEEKQRAEQTVASPASAWSGPDSDPAADQLPSDFDFDPSSVNWASLILPDGSLPSDSGETSTTVSQRSISVLLVLRYHLIPGILFIVSDTIVVLTLPYSPQLLSLYIKRFPILQKGLVR